MANPWEMDWSGGGAATTAAPGGPVYGAPPKPDEPVKPNPGAGYTMNPDGTASFIPGGSADPAVVKSDPKALQGTEQENSNRAYYDRAYRALQVYDQKGLGPRSGVGEAISNAWGGDYLLKALPDAIGDSPDRRITEQAKRDFAATILRSDSGANAPEPEVERLVSTFFPSPGETDPTILANYSEARRVALEGLRAKAGKLGKELPTYAPPPAKTQEGEEDAYQQDEDGGYSLRGTVTDTSPADPSVPPTGAGLSPTGDPANRDPSGLSGLGAIARQGVTIGLSDEAAGIGGYLSGFLTGEDPEKAYTRERDTERRFIDSARKEWGATGIGAELLGGGGAARIAPGALSLGNVLRQGGGLGALGGFGYGEGSNSVPNALLGAAGGAVLGGSLYGAGAGINALSRRPAATAEQSALIDAGQRQQIPIRRADLDPQGTARQRGVARASEEGNKIIRAADAEDLTAGEAAVGRISQGTASADRFQSGERAQSVLNRADKRRHSAAQRFYRIADDASGGQTFTPKGAVDTLDSEIARLRSEGADENIVNYLTRERDKLARPEGWTAMQLHAKRSRIREDMGAAGLPPEANDLPMIRTLDAASQDLKGALAGNQKALQAVERGDQLWRERAQLRTDVTNRLFGQRKDFSPDQTGRALEGMVKGDSSRLSRFIDEMTPEERGDFSATLVSQLGRDGQGNFSIARFLTQTEGKGALATPRAMRAVLGNDGMRAVADLRAIFKAKQAAASETNHSRTGNVVSSAGRGLRTLLFALIGGSTGGAAGAVVAPSASSWVSRIGEQRAARLLTNPDFTKWLRNAPNSTNPRVIDRYFSRLAGTGSIAANDNQAFVGTLREIFSRSPNAAAAEDGADTRRVPPQQ